MAMDSRYSNLAFAVLVQYADGGGGKWYSMKEVFANDSNPDYFGYVTGRKMSLRIRAVCLIQYE